MKSLLLFCLVLLVTLPAHAQDRDRPVAPCFPENIVMIRAVSDADFWQTITPAADFMDISGQPIAWLGYAPDVPFLNVSFLEWYGQKAGFSGVNMFKYREPFRLDFYDTRGAQVARAEVRGYEDEYLLFITSLTPYGLPDGSRYDYHVLADPRGGSCMFRLRANELKAALGWL